jgi:hypothetical protein
MDAGAVEAVKIGGEGEASPAHFKERIIGQWFGLGLCFEHFDNCIAWAVEFARMEDKIVSP